MGRLTHVISQRPMRRPLKNVLLGTWYSRTHSKQSQYILQYVDSFFSRKGMQETGFILVDTEVYQQKDHVEIVIFLYHPGLMKLGHIGLILQRKYGRYIKKKLLYTLLQNRKGLNKEKVIRSFFVSSRRFKMLQLKKFYFLISTYFERFFLMAFKDFIEQPVVVNFNFDVNHKLSARLVCEYILIKLRQKFFLGEIIYPLMRFLNRSKSVLGFRIDCSGRFTRKQRASYRRFIGGRVPLSTMKVPLDYHDNDVILKFGKCGVKVWVYHKRRTVFKGPLIMRSSL